MKLFLLPHQDDEVPVFHAIDTMVHNQQPLTIVYLTTGQASTESCERRNRESLQVLGKLGVKPYQTHFLGAPMGVADGSLQRHLEVLRLAIIALVKDTPVTGIYMPAWEGGHPDHDAAHLIGLSLAQLWHCTSQSHQFPYYHGEGLKGMLFKTLSPLAQNGPSTIQKISARKRLQYLNLLLDYQSQLKTWMGLGPFFMLHYALRGTQILQGISHLRIHEKPHPGPMLYERRRFGTFECFRQETAEFTRQHVD